jgi:5-methylcytosine-specific restriction protein A
MERRVPLGRGKPLQGGAPLARKTQLTARAGLAAGRALSRTLSTPRPPRNTGPTDKVRQAVYARANQSCERCGTSAGPFNVHHRKPRGMGGTRDVSINFATNLVLVCGNGSSGGDSTCHGWIETNRRKALADGWLVPRTAVPADTPVKVYGHGWVKLTTGGLYEILPGYRRPQED